MCLHLWQPFCDQETVWESYREAASDLVELLSHCQQLPISRHLVRWEKYPHIHFRSQSLDFCYFQLNTSLMHRGYHICLSRSRYKLSLLNFQYSSFSFNFLQLRGVALPFCEILDLWHSGCWSPRDLLLHPQYSVNIKSLSDGKNTDENIRRCKFQHEYCQYSLCILRQVTRSFWTSHLKKKNWIRKSPRSLLGVTPMHADGNGYRHFFPLLF